MKEDNAFYVRKTAEELASVEKAKSEILKVRVVMCIHN